MASIKDFEIFEAEEYIAAITQHIPDKSFQLVRCYGWYSNLTRGDRKKRQATTGESISAAADVLNIIELKNRKIPSKSWRECIKKVWKVDPLECSKCGAEMKIISFINESLLIRCILDYLGLWQEIIPKGLAPHSREVPVTIVCEEFDDGCSRSSDQYVTLHGFGGMCKGEGLCKIGEF